MLILRNAYVYPKASIRRDGALEMPPQSAQKLILLLAREGPIFQGKQLPGSLQSMASFFAARDVHGISPALLMRWKREGLRRPEPPKSLSKLVAWAAKHCGVTTPDFELALQIVDNKVTVYDFAEAWGMQRILADRILAQHMFERGHFVPSTAFMRRQGIGYGKSASVDGIFRVERKKLIPSRARKASQVGAAILVISGLLVDADNEARVQFVRMFVDRPGPAAHRTLSQKYEYAGVMLVALDARYFMLHSTAADVPDMVFIVTDLGGPYFQEVSGVYSSVHVDATAGASALDVTIHRLHDEVSDQLIDAAILEL